MFPCVFLFAQQNTFIRTYNLDGMNGGLSIEVLDEGGFVGTGQHSDNGTCRTYVYRIDECGNIIWFNLYNNGGGMALDETFDGGVIIAENQARILKLDASGDYEWERGYSNVSGYMTSIIQTIDSGYFAGGQYGQLLKLDNDGEVIWSASISGVYVHAVDEFANGDLMYFSWDGSTFWVGRVTNTGVLLWENQYTAGNVSGDNHNEFAGEALIDEQKARIIVASNNSSNAGDVLIASIDFNGNLLESNVYGSTSNADFVRSVDMTDDGGYVLGGGTYGYNTTNINDITQISGVTPENLSGRDILLFKVDSLLDFEWSSVIGCGGSDKAIGVRTNDDNGYTVSAYTDGSFFNANHFDPLFIKTDSVGRIGCQQHSPVLNQMPFALITNSSLSLSLNSSTSTINSVMQDPVFPADYYMCLECNTTPFFTISDTTICVGDTTYFLNSSSGLICFQDWFIDGNLITNSGDSIPFAFDTPGMHTVLLRTNCGTGTLDYEIDFYVNNIKLTVDSISDYNGFEISCYDFSDGFIYTSATSPFPPVMYNWGTTNPTASDQYNMNDGIYNLQLTDDFGCVFDTTFVLIEPSPIVSSYSVPLLYNGYNIICVGGQDGSVDLTVSGSVPPYNFQWSNGYTSEDLASLGAGDYIYVATDQNGCVTTDTLAIIEPILIIEDSVNHVSCADGIDGAVFVNVSGSTAPYYVIWDNNINTSMLEDGVYSYQIIDSIGCTYNYNIIVNEPQPFLVVEQVVDVSCFGENDGSVSLNITGATLPYVIDWFGYATFNMIAGTYNFTITDSNNCQYSEIAIINEPNPLDITYSISLPSCVDSYDGEIQLTVVGGTPTYNQNWLGFNPTSLGVGVFDVIVTDTNGCTENSSISLSPRSDMLIIEDVVNASCEGFCDGSADFAISNGILPYQSNWYGFNPDSLCPGVYFYEITDSLNCLYSDSILITSPDSIHLYITENSGVLYANASGGVPPYSFSWFNIGNQLGNGETHTVTYIGDYYCVAYDNQHCQSDTAFYSNIILGINQSSVNGLLVYPNPANGNLNIEFSTESNTEIEVGIIDVLGQYILLDSKNSSKGLYKEKIDLSLYARGVYLLNIRLNNNESVNKKLILK